MVRAILAGTKTQTRRIIKPQFQIGPSLPEASVRRARPLVRGRYRFMGDIGNGTLSIPEIEINLTPKYGAPGDFIWVKETFMPMPHLNARAFYRASDPLVGGKWKPSIFMPRALSRITLELTAVRVERLQDISEADARDEGSPQADTEHLFKNFRDGYRYLWEQINGPGSWAENPWVWVLEFRRIDQ